MTIKQARHEILAVNISRTVFISLIFFELLNVLKILELNTQFTWFGLLVTAIFSFILVEVIAARYRRVKRHNLHWSVWIIAVIALSLDAFGDFFYLYNRFPWWDQTVHYSVSGIVNFTFFVVISAFWVEGFRYSMLMKTGRFHLALFLASATTMSLSALYEIEEYIEDLIFHTNRLGPGTDTANDLVLNLLGILTAAAILTAYYHYAKKEEFFE